ncbi:MAG: hypothetical protein ACR2MD_10270 [Aridibacter sp.]
MSNLSDIGFPTPDEQAVNEMIMHVLELARPTQCKQGFYLKFSDASGAEIFLQGNPDQELVGFNPHFAGTSRRKVGLTQKIERDSSELDGGFHAWANPSDSDIEASGEYPFVFDVPDFRLVEIEKFPVTKEIQLTAFASNDFEIFSNEEDFFDSQKSELKYASKSFVPVGLFSFDENENIDLNVVRPIGKFAGEIKEFDRRTNQLSGQDFYWFLVETLGGAIDVVADPKFVTEEPEFGGIVSGQFWLSGRIYE